MTTREWTIPLPYTKPPWSLNQRLHFRKEAQIKDSLKGVGIVYARKLKIPPLEKFTAQLHYAPRDNRVRDGENIAIICKPLVDGICSVTGVSDSHEHYTTLPTVIHPATGQPGRLWLVLADATVHAGKGTS